MLLSRNRVAVLGLVIAFTLAAFAAGYWFAKMPKPGAATLGPSEKASAIASWLETQQIIKCVPALLNPDMFVPESATTTGFGAAPSPLPMSSNPLYGDSDATLRLVDSGNGEPAALAHNVIYMRVAFPHVSHADLADAVDTMFGLWDDTTHVFAVSHDAYEMSETLVLEADNAPPPFVPHGEAAGVVFTDGLTIGSARKYVETEMGYIGPTGPDGIAISGFDPNIRTLQSCGLTAQRFVGPLGVDTFTFVYRNDSVVAFDYRFNE